MLQLDNRTDWSAGLYPGWNRNRQLQQTLVFKAGYTFDEAGNLFPLPQPPIEETDRYQDDPETSSLVAVNETAPFKKGGELLLYGSAHPTGSVQSVLQVKISLRQRNHEFWSKELRIFGPRTWKRRLFAAIPSAPAPIEDPVELNYENAFGGTDPLNPEEYFPGNPAGVGFSLRGFRTKGLSLPQIECGPNFIASPASRVPPAGFGPLAPHWEPRCRESADIDTEALEYGGCPWSREPSESLYNVAPSDQRFDQPFEGVLTLQLKGLVADAPKDILIHLPEIKPLVSFEGQPDIEIEPPRCDTLVVDTDQQQIHLIWRTALPMDLDHPARGWVVLRDPETEAARAEESTDDDSQEAMHS
jgi:hypothetical protein